MKPINYTGNKENFILHYKFSDLRQFLKRGYEYGDVGYLFIKKENLFSIYKGFGTIGSPSKVLKTFSCVYNPIFNGEKELDPEKIVHPLKSKQSLISYDFKLINLSK